MPHTLPRALVGKWCAMTLNQVPASRDKAKCEKVAILILSSLLLIRILCITFNLHWKTNPQRLFSMSNKYSSVISHCMQSQVTDTFIHQSMYQWLDGTCILQIYHECNTRFRVFYIISWSIVNHCKYSVNIKIQLSIYDH